jgi:hypothetical protein
VPIGVAGELHLGGECVSRGYLNNAEVTAARFMPDPFSREPGARLYKSGDVARFLYDGKIEFLGRIDHQVKIRGFRVELGEIETAMAGHDSINEAVVVVREGAQSGKLLVGYVTTRDGRLFDASELRRYLKDRLADHMLPAVFVPLDRFPLMRGGKIDRALLPDPDHSSATGKVEHVLPRTQTEELITAVWSDVLGAKELGVREDFFEIGGHSLLATQVVSRIRETFGIELPLRVLFEVPTIEGLAAALDYAARVGSREDEPELRPLEDRSCLPISFAQQRLWFLNQLEPESPVYNVPTVACIDGPLNPLLIEHALNEIVNRHESLRTTFTRIDGRPTQTVLPEAAIAMPVIDFESLSADREKEAIKAAESEARQPFDLERGPLIRAIMVKLKAERHLLVITLHHIVSDVWSRAVLVKEITELYQAYAESMPPRLEPLEIQYGDYAYWQREWLQGERLERQLDYWREQLAGAPAFLDLPTDHPRPAAQTFGGATYPVELDKELLGAVNAMSRSLGVTLFMTLLAAFSALLHRYTGQDDILIGAPIAGRNRVQLERLIGFFVNTLVVRARLAGNPSFSELLKRVKETTLWAYSHQDLPFEKLVEELQPARDAAYSPLVQVVFTLQNAPEQRVELPGLNLTTVEIETATVKYDLVLDVWESDGELRGFWRYSTDLFDAGTICVIARHFKDLLAQVVGDPQRQIESIELVSPEERSLLGADARVDDLDLGLLL